MSLCSVTFICCLIIAADVSGRLSLAVCGAANPNLGVEGPKANGGDGIGTALHELVRRAGDDGDRFSIFSPNALFTRLVTAIPTPGCFPGEPGPDPNPSPDSGAL